MRNLTILILLLVVPSAHATLNVFACEPEWAALTQELAGDKAKIYTATNALQDPHRIEARPSLISKARGAQLVVCTGAELEGAWLPLVLREAGNAAVMKGKAGNFEAAHYVSMLEIPGKLDRTDGDVHAEGNPHIQLDAPSYPAIAKALSTRLSELDPNNSTIYAMRLQAFTQKWQIALQRWQQQATPLKGVSIIVQHKAFPYLTAWLGLKEVTSLEPKPGIEPSASHLAQVVATLKQHPAKMVIRAAYQNSKPSEWIAKRTGVSAVVLPFSVGGSEQAKDLFSFFDDTIARLLSGLKAPQR
ncbi:MAG: zinc ABC transporter substrate-binding protein [Gallionellaceae bacterium]|nr:zinc ABC transporter substrate-binding protein [Gallionellaceae bacterium]